MQWQVLAASAAIQLSDFPFECAISEARVGRVNGEFVINPTRAQLAESDIDMMIGASADSVMMVEGEMDEISEEEMADAIKFAHESYKKYNVLLKYVWLRHSEKKKSASMKENEKMRT